MLRIRPYIIALFFAVCAFGSVGLAQAQTRTEVERELAATEEALGRARKQLGDRHCERGAGLFESAVNMQTLARTAYADGIVGRLRLALTRTTRARRLLTEAVQVCQFELRAADELQQLYDSTREQIRQVRSRVSVKDSPEAHRFLEAAIRQLEKAEEAYRAEDFRRAAEYLDQSQKLVERAVRAMDSDVAAEAEPSAAMNELERTDEVLIELRSESLKGTQLKLFEQAESIQGRAREALREARFAQAIEFTLAARRSATDLLRDRRTGGDGTRVARAIEIVSQSLTELTPQIHASGDESAVRLLDQASAALDQGREHFDGGRLIPAARQTRNAGTLLRRAAEAAGLR